MISGCVILLAVCSVLQHDASQASGFFKNVDSDSVGVDWFLQAAGVAGLWPCLVARIETFHS